MKVHEDFVERQSGGNHYAPRVDGFCVFDRAAFVEHELHHVANVAVWHHDEAFHDRFADVFDDAHVRKAGRVVDLDVFAVGFDDFVDHAGVGGDDVHVVFPPEAFLDDLHMKEAEEAAAKAKSKSDGAFRLENECGVIELEFRHCRFEVLKIRGIYGVDTAEDHGMDFLKAD